MKAQDAEITKWQMKEGAAPDTPGTGLVVTYAKTDGKMYAKDDEGNEVCLSGSDVEVLTTKGDILVHTGSGYVRMPVGSNNQILVADSNEANGVKWIDNKKGILSYIHGDLEVETQAMSFVALVAMTVQSVKLAVDTAPTGADLIVDIHKNGTTMFTTQGNRPTIAATETSDTSVAPDVVAIAAGDKITLEIDQVGSTVAGANLAATVICEVA